MTPKEKAVELVRKFEPHARLIVNPGERLSRENHAIECALICVNQLVEVWSLNDGPPGSTYSNPGSFYWRQVLSELNKLQKQ